MSRKSSTKATIALGLGIEQQQHHAGVLLGGLAVRARRDQRVPSGADHGYVGADDRTHHYGALLAGSGAEIAGRLDALDASEECEDQDERAADV